MANSVDPDQTAPIGAVCSGSTLFASIQSNLDYSKCQGPQESFRIISSSNDGNRDFSDIFGKARML